MPDSVCQRLPTACHIPAPQYSRAAYEVLRPISPAPQFPRPAALPVRAVKRLIVFCDGTWNTPDQKDRGVVCPTNVVKLRDMVELEDASGNQQLPFYDKGVGTGDAVDRFFGGVFGIGLSHNVRDAYEFLSQNYEGGDHIFLFGFSRGAYTVRRTVGMIRKCWLLPRMTRREQRKAAVEAAYDVFTTREPMEKGGPDSPTALAFRNGFHCRPATIRCLGVWDTVGAYGIGGVLGQLTSSLSRSRFHDRRLSSIVENALQAIAIDEGRRLFGPTLFEMGPTALRTRKQVLEQSWFPGVHSNVGGGYQDAGLSNTALHWMAAHAERLGLYLGPDWRSQVPFNELGELRDSRTGLYKLMGASVRPIGKQKNGFEKAHHRSINRMVSNPDYQPSNLAAYRKTVWFQMDRAEP